MKTRILIIDDSGNEIRDLVQAVKPEVAKLDYTITMTGFTAPPATTTSGLNDPIVDVTFHEAKTYATTPCNDDLKTLGCAFDFFLIDLCWDGDKKDRKGLVFANVLQAAGIHESRIRIVTNNTTLAPELESETVTKFGAFRSFSKGELPKIAAAIYQLCTWPRRTVIPLTNAINNTLYMDRQPLERFFHPGVSDEPTKSQVIDACNTFEKVLNVWEAHGLTAAVRDHTADKNNAEKVSGHLGKYVRCAAKRTVIMPGSPSGGLNQLIEIGAEIQGQPKLKDLLFPRVRCEISETFYIYAQKIANKFGIDINWVGREQLGDSLAAAANFSVECAVPLSWFLSFSSEWLGDLQKHFTKHSIAAKLNAAVVDTQSPHHRCVVFWHGGRGFPSKSALAGCVDKLFQEAAKYSHVFIASNCNQESNCLFEVLPGGKSRDIASCKVHFGTTCFDFSRWPAGSAYLFAVPGLK